MSENVKFDKFVVQCMEVKVCCYAFRIDFFRRMLHGTKVKNLQIFRDDHNAARMLPRCSARADTTHCKTVFFRFGKVQPVFLAIVQYITVCGFILDARNRARAEGMTFTEHDLRKLVRNGLIFARKVKIDIRSFITLETKESFKRNFISFPSQRSSAVRAIFRRKVNPAA